jgi:hypothetical protein
LSRIRSSAHCASRAFGGFKWKWRF